MVKDASITHRLPKRLQWQPLDYRHFYRSRRSVSRIEFNCMRDVHK